MSKDIRILIVDDEEPFALNLARILKFRGFEASTAFDAFQALDALKAGEAFDVIILDDKMPGMDGIDALIEIKEISPDTEVIMLTGHANIDSGTRAIRRGAFDYLMKPCDAEDIVEKIREALEVERIKLRPVLWPRNVVGEIALSSFQRLETEDLLARAVDVFNRYAGKMVVEEVYVQDSNGRLKGVVTKRDLLDTFEEAFPYADCDVTWGNIAKNPDWLPEKRLKTVMRPTPPITTSPEESLIDAAHKMISEKIRCMPVVKAGEVIGIIRLQDILQHIQHETE